jgi:4-alpha-glucanotransferase
MLLPLSSVRGPRGDLGAFTDAAAIARLLRAAGFTMWQLLPLFEVSPGQESPYSAASSGALEFVYVDLDAVPDHAGDDSLTQEERGALEAARGADRVEFSTFRRIKRAALARAWARFRDGPQRSGSARAREFARFREEHAAWLPDWALYRALHDRRQRSWRDWEPALARHEEAALAEARAGLQDAIDELCYIQWIADSQWREARADCAAAGVKVLGDLPFMVAEDSTEVWSLQRYFQFDATVGVPPDAYSADGQDWGLPVPRWDAMRDAGDPWLAPRARRAAELFDAFRVDHVVGLYRTYVRPLPAGGQRAQPYFVPPAEPLQRAQGERILTLLGTGAEVLAEDLGVVPDFVRASLRDLGIPGTKVLRWEVDQDRPRDVRGFSPVSVCVTGTHDSDTLAVWWNELQPAARKLQLTQAPLRDLAEADAARFTPATRDALLQLAYSASSDGLLVPVTDALGWTDRMNTPGTVGPHNWTWRLPWRLGGELEAREEVRELQVKLHALARASGRLA